MRVLTSDRLDRFFATLAQTYELRLPILLTDGTRVIGSPEDGPRALLGIAILSKPTAAFFPQQETVFTAAEGGLQEPPAPERPLFVLGFTPRDLACLRFIDRFFADGWRDDIYFRQRRNAVVAGTLRLLRPGWSTAPPCRRRLRSGTFLGPEQLAGNSVQRGGRGDCRGSAGLRPAGSGGAVPASRDDSSG